jgi:hypothetical protein
VTRTQNPHGKDLASGTATIMARTTRLPDPRPLAE